MPNPLTYPSKSIKKAIKYPEELKNLCPLCQNHVEFKYNSGERIILTLEGPIEQRRHLYICSNSKCKFSKTPFNPAPRYDYSQRKFGKDVLIKIGEYHIHENNSPNQIEAILRREYYLPISTSTVKRMCDDILLLTSFHIDKNTKISIKNAECLLIALDGQEPDGDRPALWNFTDIISGRLLMTKYLDQVNSEIIHECIEEIKQYYTKPIIGFISDKQGAIRKCMDTFYEGIPHQYCTFHFSTNLWNHLEKFANNIHKKIKKTINKLYIHTADAKTQILIPKSGEKVSLRKLCKPLDKELISIIKKPNKKYKTLSGLYSFEIPTEYLVGFKSSIQRFPEDDRFKRIMKKTVKQLEDILNEVKKDYQNAKEGWTYFQRIHKLLWKDELIKSVKIEKIEEEFDHIWKRSQDIHPNFNKEDRKSFLPTSITPYWKILTEWTRLWDSYKSGLFKYYEFPKPVKSNVEMEQKFSTENYRFRSQAGRAHVGHMIATRGEYVLRLQYSSPSDYDFNLIIAGMREHLKDLRAVLQAQIAKSAHQWIISEEEVNYYLQLLEKMYGIEVTELRD